MNEIQYQVTKTQIGRLELAMKQLTEAPELSDQQVHPILKKAQVDGLRSLLDDLLEQVSDYEANLETKIDDAQ